MIKVYSTRTFARGSLCTSYLASSISVELFMPQINSSGVASLVGNRLLATCLQRHSVTFSTHVQLRCPKFALNGQEIAYLPCCHKTNSSRSCPILTLLILMYTYGIRKPGSGCNQHSVYMNPSSLKYSAPASFHLLIPCLTCVVSLYQKKTVYFY